MHDMIELHSTLSSDTTTKLRVTFTFLSFHRLRITNYNCTIMFCLSMSIREAGYS